MSTQTAYRRVKDDHTYEYCYRSDDTFADTENEANEALGMWEMERSCVNREDRAYRCDCDSCDVFRGQWQLYEFQKLYTVNSMAFHHHR
ncbi:hypothetical protein CYLTODRAFT_417886 [Cylindrobasidium torrendii FP15055 ss-10]|uniref:Uncharacterized protein n=1 Tax=Cylindrobasidium torrendii FP15055 ss-10 TaxID=1314674 RepID=A0A0D7BSB5_9AGAR|nr:hypothetical protein CYLTODRAFT_417886 [Cylindrobasidium torrendii FP15055 ss-10]